MRAEAAEPLILEGDPFTRGRLQAARRPERVEAVRKAVPGRLEAAAALLRQPELARYLREQRRFAEEHCAPELAELAGIAEGFALALDDLFTYLHLGILSELASAEGCTAWAMRRPEGGALLAKNRDFRGEHLGLQEVFLHRAPDLPGGAVLCVGSLGSPGVYSSGINAAGLGLADTAVAAPRHGIGWLRYLLMTRLLAACRTVPEALELIARVPHARGGNLLLADREGRGAAVELRADGPAIEEGGIVARTNHFGDGSADRVAGGDPMARTSRARLATISAALETARAPELKTAAAIMACHSDAQHEGLCRHGEDGDALTISTSLYLTAPPALYFAPGNPCEAMWRVYRTGAASGASATGW